jgi:predicted MPP superfamily phosphohydrolase
MLIFLTVFLTVYGAAHWYIWARLIKPLGLTGTSHVLMLALLLVLMCSFPVIHFALHNKNGRWLGMADLISSVWMGMVVYFVIVGIAGDLVRLVFFRGVPDGRTYSGIITGLVVLVAVYGIIEAHLVGITRLDIPLSKLPGTLDGLRVVQISDVHVGRIVRDDRLERIVDKVNALKPDLIVITGDLVDADPSHMEDMIPVLQKLRAPHGVFAVPGNHEYFAGIGRSQAMVERAGVTMLRNQFVTVAGGLQLVGRDDPVGPRITGRPIPSLAEIARRLDRSLPAILLYHTPNTTLPELNDCGIGLQLSGHTHRGQLWPFNFIVKKIYKTHYGLFSDGNTHIYVSRGTGTWGPPMRVGARPEITLITLRTKP